MPDENGETRRDRNEKFEVVSPDYEVPEAGEHVWDWFWGLSARRKSGPEALTYAEVGDWQRLTGTQVRPEEVEMLMQMDNAFLAEVRKEERARLERQREQMEGASRGRHR